MRSKPVCAAAPARVIMHPRSQTAMARAPAAAGAAADADAGDDAPAASAGPRSPSTAPAKTAPAAQPQQQQQQRGSSSSNVMCIACTLGPILAVCAGLLWWASREAPPDKVGAQGRWCSVCCGCAHGRARPHAAHAPPGHVAARGERAATHDGLASPVLAPRRTQDQPQPLCMLAHAAGCAPASHAARSRMPPAAAHADSWLSCARSASSWT